MSDTPDHDFAKVRIRKEHHALFEAIRTWRLLLADHASVAAVLQQQMAELRGRMEQLGEALEQVRQREQELEELFRSALENVIDFEDPTHKALIELAVAYEPHKEASQAAEQAKAALHTAYGAYRKATGSSGAPPTREEAGPDSGLSLRRDESAPPAQAVAKGTAEGPPGDPVEQMPAVRASRELQAAVERLAGQCGQRWQGPAEALRAAGKNLRKVADRLAEDRRKELGEEERRKSLLAFVADLSNRLINALCALDELLAGCDREGGSLPLPGEDLDAEARRVRAQLLDFVSTHGDWHQHPVQEGDLTEEYEVDELDVAKGSSGKRVSKVLHPGYRKAGVQPRKPRVVLSS